MDFINADLFATKGIEYMLVIGYLVMLVVCRRMVGPRRSRADAGGSTSRPGGLSFDLREGFHYHQGHAWAACDGSDLIRVGVDDFAQKLVGPVTGLILPRIGAELGEGEPGWKVRVNRRSIPMLSPVEGEVVRWNPEVLRAPGLVNSEPYDGGWLMEVRVRKPEAVKRNLLSGSLAHAWTDEVTATVKGSFMARPDAPQTQETMNGDGIAQMLSPGAPDRLAREFLLSQERADGGLYGGDAKYEAGQDQEVQPV